jgi:hypothetical protein
MTTVKQLSAASKALLFTLFCFFAISANAQIEGAHLFSKGLSANGFGGFLHIGAGINDADEVGGEFGLYYFGSHGQHIAIAPLLASYRHTLDGSGAGFYVEPFAGYSFGGTDIQKLDAGGNPVYTSSGSEVDQKVNGPTVGTGAGYIIPSASFPLNIGLRYAHIFVPSGDPSQNILSLRISWSLSVGRRFSASIGQ